jgi:geranylgeranyl reductase family protein
MDYDCIVVGGGPAGATASRILAGNGVSVGLLDRAHFPRSKPCGGGLTTKGYEEVGLGLDGQILNEVRAVRAVMPRSGMSELKTEQTLVRFVDRARFDHLLIRAADREGVRIHTGISITGMEHNGTSFVIRTDRSTFQAPYLLGADGANSEVNGRFGVVRRGEFGKGISIDVPRNRFSRTHVMTFDFTAISHGYGWVFPAGETVKLGLYTTNPRLKGMPALLEAFLDSMDCAGYRDLEKRSQILPFWGVHYRQPPSPVLLAGDAAGFVDPLSGEGISYAVRSGKIAAGCISSWLRTGKFNPADLQSLYEREIISTLRSGRKLANAFYGRRFPLYQILTSGPGLKTFCLAFMNGEEYPAILRRLPGYIIKGRDVRCTNREMEDGKSR